MRLPTPRRGAPGLAPALALAAALLAAPSPAAAAEPARPTDDDIFGAPAPAQPPSAAPAPAAAGTPAAPDLDPRATDLLGAGHQGPDGRIEGLKEDPLRIGGLVYLRATTSWYRGRAADEWPFSAPGLVDVFLDARPNDRVRAFALGRIFYSPTGAASPLPQDLVPVQAVQEVRGVLDQAYLTFDLDRTVFVTVGKQHVKWGTGRFWNPTDYLHPVRRDPLAQYDDRTGVALVKAHLPWEQRGWNLYALAVLEDLAGGATPATPTRAGNPVGTTGRLGVGARAEVLLGPLELAADAVAQRGHRPRFGLDGSFPLGELDVRFELALRNGPDAPRYQELPGSAAGMPLEQRFRAVTPKGVQPAAVVGADWEWKYSDEDSLRVGAEYAYDRSGYDSARLYPLLLVAPYVDALGDGRTAFTPFGLARHYAGAFASLPRPGRWNDTTFTLSVLASVTDGSGVVRLDHSVLLNTYLTLETYLAGHVGHLGGEFRFGGTFDVPPYTTSPISVAPPVVDAGVALRVKL